MGDLLGTAWVMVRADMTRLMPDLNAVGAKLKGFFGGLAGSLGGLMGSFSSLTSILSIGGMIALASKEMIAGAAAAHEQEEADKRLEAVIKSTGHAAGLSAEELKHHAAQLQYMTGVADDAIQNFQSRLLTFRNVQGDVFKRATELALDMAAVMGTDVEGAAMQLGRALNDPINGMQRLSRMGITFTDSQKAMVKQLIASGQGAKAQGIILDELQKKYGGAAVAMAGGPEGNLKKLNSQLGESREELGRAIIPLRELATELLIRFTQGLTNIMPVLISVAQFADRTFASIVHWVYTLATNMDTVWELIKASADVTWNSMIDGVMGFVDFAIGEFGNLANVIYELFTRLPEVIMGQTGLGDLIDQIMADAIKSTQNNFAKSFEPSDATKQAIARSVDLADQLLKKKMALSEADRARLGLPNPGDKKFDRPGAGKQEFNMGKGKKDKKAEVESGIYGPAELAKKLQESLLKKEDKMLQNAEAQTKVQKDMLAGINKIADKPALAVAGV